MPSATDKLRDQAAEPVLKRIRADRRRVSEDMRPLLKIIEERLFEYQLRVNTLWDESGLRSSPTSARFASELGLTPGDYITDCRLKVGAALLTGTKLYVYQIANVVGYSGGRDTFSEAFQRWSGLTPSAYRKVHRGKEDAGDTAERAMSVVVGRSARDGFSQSDVVGDASRLGLAFHERGAERAVAGDVDRAYDDLALARRCYAVAGELPPAVLRQRRLLSVSCFTDEVLRSALCPECRARLDGDEGRSLRQHLRCAVLLAPSDLPWFESGCEDCYRVLRSAVSRARFGLIDDTYKAWWLSTHAEPHDRRSPPSRGRIIAALAEAEERDFGDPLEREAWCGLAVEDAVAIGDPELEAEARRASTLLDVRREPNRRHESGAEIAESA